MPSNDTAVRYVTIINVDDRGEASFEVATGLVKEGCTITTVGATFDLSPKAAQELAAALLAASPPSTLEEIRALKGSLLSFSVVLHPAEVLREEQAPFVVGRVGAFAAIDGVEPEENN